MKANYTYLSDGTKAAAYTSASADYYPLGGPLPTGTSTTLQPEKYQGKDWNPTASFNVYDFGARLYDRSAAWTAMDPLAEKYYAVSPYVYCHNNPINWIDSDGSADWRLIKQGVIGLGTGIGSAIAGAAITEGTGGVASSIGATMVVDGVVGSLWGTTNILLGFLTSPSEENNKLIEMNLTDATDILAKSGDLVMNNQHHEIEITTNIIKIGIGFGITRGKNAHLIKSLSDVKKALVKLSSFLQIQGAVQTTLEEYLPETIEQTNQDILDAEKELMLKCQSINAFEHE